jgi:GT2 family glycosyltransferase
MIVYVIIVTYNGLKWLPKCLGSLRHSEMEVKTIVVDNFSTDKGMDYIKEYFPEVLLIESKVNLGFGKANNLGIIHALKNGADYIFLLNQDAWVDPDTIGGLVNLHQKHPGYGILSPVHLNGKGNSLDFRFSVPCNANDCPELISDLVTKSTKDIYPISFVNAALWLIPKECVEKVGLFDPIFPHYGEDLDYINRVKFFNFGIGITTNFKGYHDREERPYSEKRESTMRHLGYLCMLTDINFSFPKSLIKVWGFILVKGVGKHLMQANVKESFRDIVSGFRLSFLSNKVLKGRKISKAAGAFLPLNS